MVFGINSSCIVYRKEKVLGFAMLALLIKNTTAIRPITYMSVHTFISNCDDNLISDNSAWI